jgi:hypothetical protein
MPRRRRAGKLLVLVLIAGVAGTGLGLGIAALTRESDGTGGPAASSNGDRTASEAPAAPRGNLRLRVLGAVLHPAGTLSGQRRRRARVTVRVSAENRGGGVVTPARPVLLVAGARIPTDATADSPRTHLSAVPASETATVTLRFEVGGDVTTTLTRERRARLLLAGQTLRLRVGIGDPITVSDAGSP